MQVLATNRIKLSCDASGQQIPLAAVIHTKARPRHRPQIASAGYHAIIPERTKRDLTELQEDDAAEDAMLTLKNERSLISLWQEKRDPSSLERLISAYRPFLFRLAREKARNATIREDLINQGVVAIMESLDDYRPLGDIRFLSYARKAISAAMTEARHAIDFTIRIPRKKLRAALAGELPHDEAQRVVLLTQSSSIEDLIEDSLAVQAPGNEERIDASTAQQEIGIIISEAMSSLSDLERACIERWKDRGGDPGEFREFCSRWSISESHAKKIESRALQRLRMSIIAKGFSFDGLNGVEA